MKVLLSHGEPLIQLGLQGALGCCKDLQLLATRDFEVASFDVAVTDLDAGMRLICAEKDSPRPVIIITNDESEIGIRRAVEAGIRGYLLLSSTPESIVQAVRRVGQGGIAIDPRALLRMVDGLNGSKLTDREHDVLRLVALGRSNKAVANQLGIAVGTAKHHMKHLMAKLNARSRTEAASIAQRRGLLRRDERPAEVHRSLAKPPNVAALRSALAEVAPRLAG